MEFSGNRADSPGESPRILVVDDDRATCVMVARMLCMRGYSVDVAHDGECALELIQTKDYALALIDYRMPGMDGIELYRRIRQLRPEMAGVFLTGYPTIDTVFPAIGIGVERVLAKPADSDELYEVVEQFAGRPT